MDGDTLRGGAAVTDNAKIFQYTPTLHEAGLLLCLLIKTCTIDPARWNFNANLRHKSRVRHIFSPRSRKVASCRVKCSKLALYRLCFGANTITYATSCGGRVEIIKSWVKVDDKSLASATVKVCLNTCRVGVP